MSNDEKSIIELLVPDGCYCYDSGGRCPFWSKDSSKPPQENGYCSFLKGGDWGDGWDCYGISVKNVESMILTVLTIFDFSC